MLVELIVIIVLSFSPLLVSFFVLRKAKERLQMRLTRERALVAYRQYRRIQRFRELETPEKLSPFVGDISCRFNAHSPHLRCAINPTGPCEECSNYESS